MGSIEVQGIVAFNGGLPWVQFRQIDDEGKLEAQWQLTPSESREFAQKIVEASMNAVYDAALIAWAKEMSPDNPEMGARMVSMIRQYRADIWGLPNNPEDWRTDGQ